MLRVLLCAFAALSLVPCYGAQEACAQPSRLVDSELLRLVHTPRVDGIDAETLHCRVSGTPGAAKMLSKLLADGSESPHWATIAQALGATGSEEALKSLVGLVGGKPRLLDARGRMRRDEVRGREMALVSIGYVARWATDSDVKDKAITYLSKAAHPGFWDAAAWVSTAKPQGNAKIQLSMMAVWGLGHSRSPAARMELERLGQILGRSPVEIGAHIGPKEAEAWTRERYTVIDFKSAVEGAIKLHGTPGQVQRAAR